MRRYAEHLTSLCVIVAGAGTLYGAIWLGSHGTDIITWWKHSGKVEGLQFHWIGYPDVGDTLVMHGPVMRPMEDPPDGARCFKKDWCQADRPGTLTVISTGNGKIVARYAAGETRERDPARCECLDGQLLILEKDDWRHYMRRFNGVILLHAERQARETSGSDP